MTATRMSRHGPLLAAVVVVMGFTGGSELARADLLVNRLTEVSAAVPGSRGAQTGTSPVSYQPRLHEEREDETEPPAQAAPLSPWKALVLTLTIPPPLLTSMTVSEKASTAPQPSAELPRNFTFATQVKPPAYPGTVGVPLSASAAFPPSSSATTPRQSLEPSGLIIGLLGAGITGLASLLRRKRAAAEGA